MSTNYVLYILIDDIFEGTVSVIDGLDALVIHVKIFLNFLGFLADYPASSKVVDLMGHSARDPCTRCKLRYRNIP